MALPLGRFISSCCGGRLTGFCDETPLGLHLTTILSPRLQESSLNPAIGITVLMVRGSHQSSLSSITPVCNFRKEPHVEKVKGLCLLSSPCPHRFAPFHSTKVPALFPSVWLGSKLHQPVVQEWGLGKRIRAYLAPFCYHFVTQSDHHLIIPAPKTKL